MILFYCKDFIDGSQDIEALKFGGYINNDSIDLYKMPLLNTHGLATEYCEVTSKVAAGTIKDYQKNIYEKYLE